MIDARIAAIIPVGTLEAAKSRLGGALDAEERQDLAERFLARTIGAALTVDRLADVVVVSPDREVLQRAADIGARTLRQRTRGLNAGLAEAREDVVAGGADAILVLPIDLPFVTAEAITAVLAPIDNGGPDSRVVLVTDRHGSGTNVLALRPPGAIDFFFGPGSRQAHREAAAASGATYTEIGGPLAFDLDTPADLVLFEAMAPEGIRAS
ncbi:MAG: 2-phospho-L-lactate guanylyltransferase [Chloroflexota bacterium]